VMHSPWMTGLLRRRAVGTALVASGLAILALVGCSKEEPSSSSGGTGATPPPKTATSGPSAQTGAKKIVFVFKIGGISYSDACKAGAEQANADPQIGADVEYQAPTEATSEKQADIINQAIVGKADAIVVSPNDAGAIIPVLQKAADAGIQVFTWDSDSPKSPRKFYVRAVDDIQIGADIAGALAKSIGDKGKVLVFSGGRTAENLNLHVEGIEAAMKNYPGITLVRPYIYNDDDKGKATTMAIQALQKTPDAAGIACCNSPSPPAAGEAIRKLNLIGKVKVWGLALPSETKSYLLDGSVTGLYLWDPQKLTYLTAKLVKDALDGKMPQDGQTLPEGKITVNGPLVTLPLRLEINKGNVESLKF
jgi:ABC-type sugar transport system substrate-binding protein